jgi:hypothetical protein
MKSVNPLAETAKEGKQLPIAFGEVIRGENFEPVCEVEIVVRFKPPN